MELTHAQNKPTKRPARLRVLVQDHNLNLLGCADVALQYLDGAFV